VSVKKETLDLSKTDPEFVKRVAESGGEKILLCIQCGTCSGGCPAGRRTAYRTRQVVRRALAGLKDEVLSSRDIWLCSTCYTCLERCPRGINVTDVILILRNLAVQAGFMLKPHKDVSTYLLRTGHAVPIIDKYKALRKELKLPELPPTTHSYPDALGEVQRIANKTGFDKLIGFEG
jgi:heterodisulfide reductase subunit C